MFNQGVNAQYEPQVTQDGVAGSMVARGPAAVGVQETCGTLSDGAHRGGGLTDRTHTAVAFLPSVANPLTHRMHKGMNTTVDEGQTPIVTTGGFFDEATCFKPSHFTRGKDGKPSDVTPPLSADADKGDQDTVVCATGQRTHALTTRAACEEDGTGRGNPIVPAHAVGFNWQNGGGYGKANDGLGITEEGTGPLQRCNTPAVAFTQNQREEVRILDVASACSAEPGSHQQTYIAQEAVAYVKATNPHSKEEAPRYEEAAVSACLNGRDERHDPPKHMVAACRHPATEALYTKGYSGGQQDACTQEADTGKALRVLRQEVGEKDFAQWGLGILDSFQRKEVLRSSLLGARDGQEEEVADSKAGREVVGRSSQGAKYLPERRLSEVRQAGRERRTPQGWKLSQQLSRELGAYLQELPHQGAQTEAALLDLWKASEGLRVLRDALPEVQEVGRSTSCERQSVHSGSQGYRSEREEEVRGSWVRSVGACEGPLRSPLDAEEARDARITAEDEKRDSQRNVGQSPLCVRRLVPSECEFLMGFPAGHTDIIFRKKPAADGPRYRALGNSMAVPCMFWLGHRIHQATQGDNA